MSKHQKTIKETKSGICLLLLLSTGVLSTILQGCSVSSAWKSQKGSNANNSFSSAGGIKGSFFWKMPKQNLVTNMVMDQNSILYYSIDFNQDEAVQDANTTTPSVKWTYTPGVKIKTALSLDDDQNVFFGCEDKNLYQVKNGTLQWQFLLTSGEFRTSPLVSDGKVYIGTNDGTIYCIDYNLKKVNWTYKADACVVSISALPGNMLYFVTLNNNVYAIDILNAVKPITPKWVKPLVGTSINVEACFPQTFTNLLVASSNNNHDHVRAYDPNTGAPIWDYETSENCEGGTCLSYICANNDKLFLFGSYGIKAIRTKDGKMLWEDNKTARPFWICQPVVDSKGILYIADDGKITAINENTKQEIWSKPINQNLNLNMIIGGKYLYLSQKWASFSTDPNSIFAFE